MTFYLSIKTAAQIEAEAAQARAEQIKAECATVIFAVLNQNTQASLLAAAVSGALGSDDMQTFRKGQAWIEATKAESRNAIAEGRDPVWPEPTLEILELANRY